MEFTNRSVRRVSDKFRKMEQGLSTLLHDYTSFSLDHELLS